MKISEVEKMKRSYRGHAVKPDFSQANGEDITIKEFNKKFGLPKLIYCDTNEPIDPGRPCAKCKMVCKKNEPDPCIGYIEKSVGACCGHGDDEFKYVNLINDETGEMLHLRGKEYDLFMECEDYEMFKYKYLATNSDNNNLNHLELEAQLQKLKDAGWKRVN